MIATVIKSPTPIIAPDNSSSSVIQTAGAMADLAIADLMGWNLDWRKNKKGKAVKFLPVIVFWEHLCGRRFYDSGWTGLGKGGSGKTPSDEIRGRCGGRLARRFSGDRPPKLCGNRLRVASPPASRCRWRTLCRDGTCAALGLDQPPHVERPGFKTSPRIDRATPQTLYGELGRPVEMISYQALLRKMTVDCTVNVTALSNECSQPFRVAFSPNRNPG
jgi:hypothetical protein